MERLRAAGSDGATTTMMRCWPCLAGLLPLLLALASAALAAAPDSPQSIAVTADQLLAMAGRAQTAGDLAVAETAYRALFADPSVETRSEARFRLALMLSGQRRLNEAAVLLRAILDEQPKAQRVRLELARVLDMLGDEAGARRALREAQAGGLPPDVARLVDRYSAALRAQKPLGASLDLAVAPDSNINRATRSNTLGTVIGDFELDPDAQQQSGIGLAFRGQAYGRFPISKGTNLFARMSGSANLYRASNFNDVAISATIGPELRLGADRLSLETGGLWRWFGGRAFSRAATLEFNYFHPLGRKAQLRGMGSIAFTDNRFNAIWDGQVYAASLSYERAVSNRAGFSVTLSADRQSLMDPGYALWGGQATLLGYREIGPVTVIASLGFGRLVADERIALFPRRRSDQSYRASLGATFRNLRVGSFAPFARLSYEKNDSTIELYAFNRLRSEFGITRAF
ncbi:porin family protein [Sandarakinorhabdus rubra]|uniref:porin family protein n=1 Tax=Sandarakinorhabdus rubra TaxID=2672568 RepID=UPI001F24B9E9|nr:porin family protein [Sandarakinorhabdus rubra]